VQVATHELIADDQQCFSGNSSQHTGVRIGACHVRHLLINARLQQIDPRTRSTSKDSTATHTTAIGTARYSTAQHCFAARHATMHSRVVHFSVALVSLATATSALPGDPPVGPMPFANVTRLTMMSVTAVAPSAGHPTYSLALTSSNVTQVNFDAVTACVRRTMGAGGKPIELLITLSTDIPLWTHIANTDVE
jgi:hypothetical protein